MDWKRLRDVPLFAGLRKQEVEALGRITDEVDVAQGHVLAREGDTGHEFFIIEDGRAQVTVGEEVVGDLGPGDFFGEIALIREERRTATVTAATSMTVIVLTRSAFRSLRHSLPQIFEKVEAEISRRTASATASPADTPAHQS